MFGEFLKQIGVLGFVPSAEPTPLIPANAIATESNIAITTESGDILVT
jgi:hypothetical protein